MAGDCTLLEAELDNAKYLLLTGNLADVHSHCLNALINFLEYFNHGDTVKEV